MFGRKRSGPGESTRLVVVEKTKTIVLGHAVSDDLKKFVGVFQPYAADTDEGKALRKKGFHFADPSGNGLCSVAEIENFILVTLLAAFPKQAKADLDVGRDLFTAFRPCYIRAYNDAKDYKADDGTVLEGTKKSTADDLVSKVEFRVFNAQLVVYAMMFDAFALVDGGGAGRKAIEDRRIEKAEWMARYNDVVMPYGFAAFKGLVNDKQADAAFKKMDADGAGMVLLIEWCAFIKAAEVEAGTPVGQVLLLGADENGELGGKRAHGRSKKRKEEALKAKEAAQRAKAAANKEKSDKASARKRERRAQEGITIQEMELCAREIIAEELAGQKEVWAARQANGELDTVWGGYRARPPPVVTEPLVQSSAVPTCSFGPSLYPPLHTPPCFAVPGAGRGPLPKGHAILGARAAVERRALRRRAVHESAHARHREVERVRRKERT